MCYSKTVHVSYR